MQTGDVQFLWLGEYLLAIIDWWMFKVPNLMSIERFLTLMALAVSDTHAGLDAVTIANLCQLNAINKETTLLETW